MSYQGKDRPHTEEKSAKLIDQNDACLNWSQEGF